MGSFLFFSFYFYDDFVRAILTPFDSDFDFYSARDTPHVHTVHRTTTVIVKYDDLFVLFFVAIYQYLSIAFLPIIYRVFTLFNVNCQLNSFFIFFLYLLLTKKKKKKKKKSTLLVPLL